MSSANLVRGELGAGLRAGEADGAAHPQELQVEAMAPGRFNLSFVIGVRGQTQELFPVSDTTSHIQAWEVRQDTF